MGNKGCQSVLVVHAVAQGSAEVKVHCLSTTSGVSLKVCADSCAVSVSVATCDCVWGSGPDGVCERQNKKMSRSLYFLDPIGNIR